MFFSDDLGSPVNSPVPSDSKGPSSSPVNSYGNPVRFRPMVLRQDSELFSKSTNGSNVNNGMDSSTFTQSEFTENYGLTEDDASMSHSGARLPNLPLRKSSSYSVVRTGAPLDIPTSSKSEGSTFQLLGTRLGPRSPKSGAVFTHFESPVKQAFDKTDAFQMTLDDTMHDSPKKQTQFVEAGLEVPGLEHRLNMDGHDSHSLFSSSRLSSFVPDPGSFFDLAQYKARLEEQLSLNKSDSMRKADSNDSLEYRLFGETQEYNNLINSSNSVSSEPSNGSGELGLMDSTQFDRFTHFGYSFNKLLNSLTWLASLHLSCRTSNLYLSGVDNNYLLNQVSVSNQNVEHTSDSYYYHNTTASTNHYPVNYVTDHDMTPEVQTTMLGYPVYANSVRSNSTFTSQNYKTNTTTNYTMNNTHFATNSHESMDNIINLDNDFNMDNNYNYSQPSFSNRSYNTSKVNTNNSGNYNSSPNLLNTHNYGQGRGYGHFNTSNLGDLQQANQLHPQHQQSLQLQSFQQSPKAYQQQYNKYHQVSGPNNYHTSVPNEPVQVVRPNQLGTNLNKNQNNYRGRYFYNNRVVDGVEQEVYDLDVDLGIFYSRRA